MGSHNEGGTLEATYHDCTCDVPEEKWTRLDIKPKVSPPSPPALSRSRGSCCASRGEGDEGELGFGGVAVRAASRRFNPNPNNPGSSTLGEAEPQPPRLLHRNLEGHHDGDSDGSMVGVCLSACSRYLRGTRRSAQMRCAWRSCLMSSSKWQQT